MGVIIVPFIVVMVLFGAAGLIHGARLLFGTGGSGILKVAYVTLISIATMIAAEAKSLMTALAVVLLFGFFYALIAGVNIMLNIVQVGSENGFSLRRRR